MVKMRVVKREDFPFTINPAFKVVSKLANQIIEVEPFDGDFSYQGYRIPKEWLRFPDEVIEPVEEVAAPTKETTESRPQEKVFKDVHPHNKISIPREWHDAESLIPQTPAGKISMIDSILNPKSEDSEDESGSTLLALPEESAGKGVSITNVSDPVSNPSHYKFSQYEPVKVIQAWGLSFCLGNVVKYIARAGRKDSSKLIEDLEKAKRYIEFEIEHLRKK